jgi:hypothetical protein
MKEKSCAGPAPTLLTYLYEEKKLLAPQKRQQRRIQNKTNKHVHAYYMISLSMATHPALLTYFVFFFAYLSLT